MSKAIVLLALLAAASAADNSSELTLTLLSDTIPAAKGGRCMDGSMTGYYFRQGVDTDTFVIFMHGSGGCSSQGTCKKWAAEKGSSKDFARTQSGDHAGVAGGDCATNPYFCNATAAIVPYCTGDSHRGNRTVASEATFGWIFDGHASFVAVIEELISTRGLGKAKRVLLTGSSAGGIGVFYNLDWLAARLPGADVKGAPMAGWFFPAALPGDLADVYPPSDFSHFNAGTHGNQFNDPSQLQAYVALYDMRGVFSADCMAAQPAGQWWACFSVHKQYPYVKTPVFVIENQFDTSQIYAADGHIPKQPTSAEAAAVQRYVAMYGEAMRNSTAQVLNNASVAKKRVPDGLFLPSCFQHPVDVTEQIAPPGGPPQAWPLLLGDWFFEQNALQQYHRLVESCPTGLPCNPLPICKYTAGPSPGPAPAPGSCVAGLTKDGCLPNSETDCETCAKAHENDLKVVGCTPKAVQQLCKAGPSPGPSPGPTPAPTPGGCAAQFAKDDCLPNNQADCYHCVHKHKSDLDAAGCTSGEARKLCTAYTA